MVESGARSTRRDLLKGIGAVGALGAFGALERRPARAADKLVVGVIYVGPRDDYGYNQAQAQAPPWPATTPRRDRLMRRPVGRSCRGRIRKPVAGGDRVRAPLAFDMVDS